MTIEEQLEGWGMDVEALKGEGAFLSPPKVPRAFSTNVSNDPTTGINTSLNQFKEDEWCNYANMPSPKAYM